MGKKKRKVIEAHRGLLAFYSGYFEAALSDEFIKAGEQKVYLEDQDPSVVNAFVKWCYSRQISPRYDEKGAKYRPLFDLWVFGNHHTVPLLQNELCATIVHQHAEDDASFSIELDRVYLATHPGAPLRRLVMALLASDCDIDKHMSPEGNSHFCRDALVDLVLALYAMVNEKQSHPAAPGELYRWDLCQFHVHEEGVKCPEKA